jgi:hypothetical protein
MNEPNPSPGDEKRFPEVPPASPAPTSRVASASIKRSPTMSTPLKVLLILLVGIPLGLVGLGVLVLGVCLLGSR